jgi:hypothetical protein
MKLKLLGIIVVGNDVADHLLIRFFCITHILGGGGEEYSKTDFKKGYDSFRKEVLYNILIDFELPVKLCS